MNKNRFDWLCFKKENHHALISTKAISTKAVSTKTFCRKALWREAYRRKEFNNKAFSGNEFTKKEYSRKALTIITYRRKAFIKKALFWSPTYTGLFTKGCISDILLGYNWQDGHNFTNCFLNLDIFNPKYGQNRLDCATKKKSAENHSTESIEQNTYGISSYKTLPRIIPAFLIIPTPGTLLRKRNLVISNNTHGWRPYKK